MSLIFSAEISICPPLYAFEDSKVATLIVSYQTGPKGERLDRVRFRLCNENCEQQLFPKGKFYSDPKNSDNSSQRIVVIEGLPSGKYTLEFLIPNSDDLFEAVAKRSFELGDRQLLKIDQLIRPRYASLKALANNSSTDLPFATLPTITLENHLKEIRAQSTMGKINVHYLIPGDYTLTFEELPGYIAPSPLNITLLPNENAGPFLATYQKINHIVETEQLNDIENESAKQGPSFEYGNQGDTILLRSVPAGPSTIGAVNAIPINELPARSIEISAFSIGTYEVTNAQMAEWLNEAMARGKVRYTHDGPLKGIVTGIDGELLCHTLDSAPLSQIQGQYHDDSTLHFSVLPGKENYPAIYISWHGANHFCRDHGGRLPTEAEWEKAASVTVDDEGKTLKKLQYAFDSNDADLTWANFKGEESGNMSDRVLTKEVGFYNGKNRVTFIHQGERQQLLTHHAQSPYGAYDMSGNVWEWVNDWYSESYSPAEVRVNPQGPAFGKEKVAKGGCYDSYKQGVRAAERIGLNPDHTDQFTGFRIAMPKID